MYFLYPFLEIGRLFSFQLQDCPDNVAFLGLWSLLPKHFGLWNGLCFLGNGDIAGVLLLLDNIA